MTLAAERLGTPVADAPSATEPVRPARPLRLALAGGGTGGHVVPGLHLLRHLAERPGGARGSVESVLWFGAGRAAERRAREGLDEALGGVPFEAIDLPLEPGGGGAPSTGALLVRTTPAVRRARAALVRQRADVVCGLGGFTSLPVVLAARSLRIPVGLLEINAVPGRATRWLAPLSHRVLCAWPSTVPSASSGRRVARPGNAKSRYIGPPLGPEHAVPKLSDRARSAERGALGFDPDRPLVVVLGGSQGAGFLNTLVRERASELTGRGLSLLHQTGPGRAEEGAGEVANYRAVEYVDRVDRALRAADVVLCRGGASTLAEVAASGTPAIVVPYPHHKDRHQRRNADALDEGVVVVEESSGADSVLRELLTLVEDADDRVRRSERLEALVPRDGARRLFDELVLLSASRVSQIESA